MWNLETRVKEHFRNVKYKDTEKSPVAYHFWITQHKVENEARRAGSDGSMSASGSAGPGFDPRLGSKFSFENFQPWGRRGGVVHFLIARLYITGLD